MRKPVTLSIKKTFCLDLILTRARARDLNLDLFCNSGMEKEQE